MDTRADNINSSTYALTLRQKAEELLKKRRPKTKSKLSEVETQKLIHELQVHQIELELQNEELRRAKEQVEVVSKKYVTECRQAGEGQPESSEECFRLLYENAKIGLYRTTPDGTIILANRALLAMLGYLSFDEIAKGNINKDGFESPDHRKAFIERIEQTGEVDGFESTWIRQDRSPVFVRESARAIRDTNGKTLFYDGIVEDITVRKQAENALHESELRFKQISENAQEWIWEHDANGLYTYVSPVCKELLGYEVEEIVGIKYFYDSFDPENKEEMKQAAFGAFARKESFRNFINGNIHKDGKKVIFSSSGVPILDKENNLIGYRGVDVDITERIHAEDKLKRSEEQLKEAQSVTHIGSWELDLVENRGTMSDEMYKIFDLNSSTDVTIESFLEAPIPEDREMVRETVMKSLETHEPADFDFRTYTPNGEIRWIHEKSAVEVDDKGNPKRVFGTSQDITDRKLAELNLKESEEKYRLLAESSPEMIYLVDTKGYVTYVNKVAAAQFHTSARELIGKHLTDIFPPDLAKQNLANIQNVIGTKSTFQNEVEMIFPMGNRWIDARLTPVFDEKKNVIGVLGLSYDITERKQAEEKINMLAHAVKNSADCIFITNKNHEFIFVNDSFCKVYGFKKEEIVGQPVAIIISKNNLPEIDNDLFSTINKKKIWSGESINKRKNGNDFPIQLSLAPLLDDKDELIAIAVVARDITERKRAEEEIRLKNEQLLKLNAEKDKFFSIIAHDLRGPLGGLMGLTEIMANDSNNLTPDQKKELTLGLSRSARNIFNLLGNLLEWSQIRRGNTEFSPRMFNLKEVLNGSVKTVNELAKNKGIEIAAAINGEQKIFADSNMIQTVVHNLVSNAIKFTPKGGKIIISAEPKGNNAVGITVKDTGIGMSSEMLDNLFRLDAKNNRPGTEGESSTGLGLLLCKEFIEKHGGKIWVESEEGIGSAFYFTLPFNAG